MDARAGVGLGHRHRFAQVQLAAHLARQDGGFRRAAQHGALGIGQNAQAVCGQSQRRLGLIVAVGVQRIVVVARAQKDEMIALQPFQEGDVLGQDGGIDRGRGLFQSLHGLAHQGRHGVMIGDGGVDVRQALGQAFAQGVAALLRHAVDDQHDDRQAAAVQLDHRVEQGAHGHGGLGQGAHDAVDQEGGVGLDDAHQIVIQHLVRRAVQRADGNGGRGRVGRIGLGGGPGGGEQGGQILAAQLGRLIGGIVFVRLGQIGLFDCAGPGPHDLGEGRLQRGLGDRLNGLAQIVGGHGRAVSNDAAGPQGMRRDGAPPSLTRPGPVAREAPGDRSL